MNRTGCDYFYFLIIIQNIRNFKKKNRRLNRNRVISLNNHNSIISPNGSALVRCEQIGRVGSGLIERSAGSIRLERKPELPSERRPGRPQQTREEAQNGSV